MATKFYVPELGDKITLAEPFTFNLHAENRNSDLISAFGHYIAGYKLIVNSEDLPPMRDADLTVNYPDSSDPKFQNWLGRFDCDAYNKACKEAEEAVPERAKYYEDFRNHQEESRKIGKPSIEVTLPAGTELTIDRIYIRKGSLDFSSITFRTTSLGRTDVRHRWRTGTKSKKSLRFWVKLQECNTIVFKS